MGIINGLFPQAHQERARQEARVSSASEEARLEQQGDDRKDEEVFTVAEEDPHGDPLGYESPGGISGPGDGDAPAFGRSAALTKAAGP